jgi:monofunctional biosynthetic peptidoglycan transglycosylase
MLRVLRFLVWTVVGFVGLSVAFVVLYRFVPVPVTATMLMDRHGITKDWESLDNIDRNMVRAVIAAEDGKFCEHDGFDPRGDREGDRAQRARRAHSRRLDDQPADRRRTCSCGRAAATVRKGLEAWFTLLIENSLGASGGSWRSTSTSPRRASGTYGIEARSQRYFKHSAARLSPSEAARIAAALPLPKERAVISPSGFTRRYGNTIQARIGVVRRDALDSCVYD